MQKPPTIYITLEHDIPDGAGHHIRQRSTVMLPVDALRSAIYPEKVLLTRVQQLLDESRLPSLTD